MAFEFRQIDKFCEGCGEKLVLKNTRDIIRKRFCSRKCNVLNSLAILHSDPLKTQKIVAAMNTADANRKKGHPGSANPKWKHDRTQIKTKRLHFEERQFMKDVLQERDFTCEITGERGGKLSVHHKNGVRDYPHLRFVRTNVVVIKKSIHQTFHNMYGTINITETLWNKFIENKEYACQQ